MVIEIRIIDQKDKLTYTLLHINQCDCGSVNVNLSRANKCSV